MKNQAFLSAWNVKRECSDSLILAREYGVSDKLGKKNLFLLRFLPRAKSEFCLGNKLFWPWPVFSFFVLCWILISSYIRGRWFRVEPGGTGVPWSNDCQVDLSYQKTGEKPWKQRAVFRVRRTWVWILASLISTCVTLGNIPNFSET